jgi:hypothetical protein
MATSLDASIPSGVGAMNVTSGAWHFAPAPQLSSLSRLRPHRPGFCLHLAGAAKKQALEKANNVALKGNTVLFGRLVGVVFATGPRTVLGRTKDLFSNRSAPPKLKRGIDKKKVRALPGKDVRLAARRSPPHPCAFAKPPASSSPSLPPKWRCWA